MGLKTSKSFKLPGGTRQPQLDAVLAYDRHYKNIQELITEY